MLASLTYTRKDAIMKQISLYTKKQCEMILKPHNVALPTSNNERLFATAEGLTLFRKVKSRGRIFYEMQFRKTYNPCKPEDRLFHIDD